MFLNINNGLRCFRPPVTRSLGPARKQPFNAELRTEADSIADYAPDGTRVRARRSRCFSKPCFRAGNDATQPAISPAPCPQAAPFAACPVAVATKPAKKPPIAPAKKPYIRARQAKLHQMGNVESQVIFIHSPPYVCDWNARAWHVERASITPIEWLNPADFPLSRTSALVTSSHHAQPPASIRSRGMPDPHRFAHGTCNAVPSSWSGGRSSISTTHPGFWLTP